MIRSVSNVIDASAITLSGLCVVHCLALPLLAVLLPIAGIWAEAEWVHKTFVILALPLSGIAILRGIESRRWALFAGLAVTGLALLIGAAFVEALHHIETPLTVLGATALAAAHIWRWAHHRSWVADENNCSSTASRS